MTLFTSACSRKSWLSADVTPVRSPDECGMCFLGGDFGWALFWSIQAIFVVERGILCCKSPLLSPNNLTQGRPMKIKWLVADVTVGSPERAEGAILGMILVGRIFGQFRLYL